MRTRERAATRAPTITPISWPELDPDCGGAATSLVVEPVVVSCGVVLELGGGVGAMVVADGVEEVVAVEGGGADEGASGTKGKENLLSVHEIMYNKSNNGDGLVTH